MTLGAQDWTLRASAQPDPQLPQSQVGCNVLTHRALTEPQGSTSSLEI